MTAVTDSRLARSERRYQFSWTDAGPFLALAALMVAGYLINPDFLSATNLGNVVTRSAYVAIIAVGATFVTATQKLAVST